MVMGLCPLVTSVLRLVVITTLLAANLTSVCRTYKLPKFRGVLSYKRLTILTILILNLMYLAVIWVPFTITTFKHNLQDLWSEGVGRVQTPTTFALEYLDRNNGSLVQETLHGRVVEETPVSQWILPGGNDPQGLTSAGFDKLKKFRNKPIQWHSRLGKSLNRWITRVQDLITSSFTYSVILIVVVEKIMGRKGMVVSPLRASLLALLLAVMPVPLTLAIRSLANTTNLFAVHIPEVKSGYTMYSIICDVNITESYVVGLFLEWTVVLLLAAVLLVVTRKHFTCLPEDKIEESCAEEDGLIRVEDVACRFVLLTGASWAWPIKPLLVIILFFINGPHWNNAVCWLANMVVAIPVSFMPLAVFLARPEDPNSYLSYNVFRDENIEVVTEKKNLQNPAENCASCPVKAVGMSAEQNRVISSDTHKDASEKENQIKENLKFYLGTDIFRHKDEKEDEICILNKPDDNESHV